MGHDSNVWQTKGAGSVVGNGEVEGQEAASLSKTHVAYSRTAACCMRRQQLRALIATLYAHFNGLSTSLSHLLTPSLSLSLPLAAISLRKAKLTRA